MMVMDNNKQCGKGRVTCLDLKLARLLAAEYLEYINNNKLLITSGREYY